ncbi:MAG: hypothetical protein WBX19_14325 [Terracidiphilus sp.]
MIAIEVANLRIDRFGVMKEFQIAEDEILTGLDLHRAFESNADDRA